MESGALKTDPEMAALYNSIKEDQHPSDSWPEWIPPSTPKQDHYPEKRQNQFSRGNRKENDQNSWKQNFEDRPKRSKDSYPNHVKIDNKTLKELYQNEKPEHKKYILHYRVKKCHENCNNSECLNYHPGQVPRRVPYPIEDAWNYWPKMCQNEKYCRNGVHCKYAHSLEEVSYHPIVYKVQNCRYEKNEGQSCKNKGSHCSYAHSDDDRRAPGLQPEKPKFNIKTFKTEPCIIESCKNQDCLGYHDEKQRRRNLDKFRYDAIPCIFVFRERKFLDPNLCPNGDDCNKAHTKNEIYFHQSFYKTKPCKKEACRVNNNCPFLHQSHKDKKNVESAATTKIEQKPEENKISENLEQVPSEIPSDLPQGNVETTSQENEDKPKEKPKAGICKFYCKKCGEREMEWLFECGVFVCTECLDQECISCKKKHVTKLNFN
ncbi:unnamed protein product [Blepharisma stoltei]|uniref:C3H1-type domain-containing protein n=1 Tax=Blepharisma stoltei TaxID=1481888 RepID=A0AAU9JBQ6_9CILI|nr:unnamed protein product [Blepharisma stoltei]